MIAKPIGRTASKDDHTCKKSYYYDYYYCYYYSYIVIIITIIIIIRPILDFGVIIRPILDFGVKGSLGLGIRGVWGL